MLAYPLLLLILVSGCQHYSSRDLDDVNDSVKFREKMVLPNDQMSFEYSEFYQMPKEDPGPFLSDEKQLLQPPTLSPNAQLKTEKKKNYSMSKQELKKKLALAFKSLSFEDDDTIKYLKLDEQMERYWFRFKGRSENYYITVDEESDGYASLNLYSSKGELLPVLLVEHLLSKLSVGA